MSRLKIVLGIMALFFVSSAGLMGLFAGTAAAARTNTSDVCWAAVRLAKHGTLTDGRKYVTMEYRLMGNDNGRRFLEANGNVPTEPGWFVNSASNCLTPGGGHYWDGKRVDFGSQDYKNFFQDLVGKNIVQDIYFGLPNDTNFTYPVSENYNNGNVGWYDNAQGFNAKRALYGITPNPSAASNSPKIFASLNDAGYIMLNNSRVWCLGMDFPFVNGAGCRGGDAATAYVGGGDFAGWQQADNANALANVSPAYRGRVQSQSSIKDLLGIGPNKQYFDLSMAAQNTRDAVPPGLSGQCQNTKPGTAPCLPGFGDPLMNNKTSAVFTFILADDPNLEGEVTAASCSVVRGWSADKSNYNHQTTIRVTYDERGGSNYVDLRPDTDGGAPETGEYRVIPHQGMPGAGGVPASPQHGFEIPASVLSQYADAYPRTLYVEVIGINGNREELVNGERTVGPCEPPKCKNSAVITPNPPAAGQSFTANVGLNYSPGIRGRPLRYDMIFRIVNATTGASIASTNPPLASPDKSTGGPPNLTGLPDANGHTFTNLTQATTGPYTARWNLRWNNDYAPDAVVNGGQQEQLCTDNYNVGDRPYLRVYGNDVAAGSGFTDGTSCVRDNQAAIEAFQNGVVGARAGAGGQLGVFALGQIDGFFSASLRNTGPPPNTHNGLTFGNFNGSGYLTGWGGLSGLPFCSTDYFAQAAATGTAVEGSQTITAAAIPSGSGPQSRVAKYVEGNVYIQADAQGRGVYYIDNAWSNPDQIPSYYLIVKGNIFIDNDVERLDGVFIAQPQINQGNNGAPSTVVANTGRIITCTDSNSGSVPAGTAACSKVLTINGAFIANKVYFYRTNGKVATAQATETASNTTNVAEVFKFSPEIYLSPLNPSLSKGQPDKKYDYFTSLPPIL